MHIGIKHELSIYLKGKLRCEFLWMFLFQKGFTNYLCSQDIFIETGLFRPLQARGKLGISNN